MKSHRYVPVSLAALVSLTGCSSDLFKSLLNNALGQASPQPGGSLPASGSLPVGSTGSTDSFPFAGTWYSCNVTLVFSEDAQRDVQGTVTDSTGQVLGTMTGMASGSSASLQYTPDMLPSPVYNEPSQGTAADLAPQSQPSPPVVDMELVVNGNVISGTVNANQNALHITLTRQQGAANSDCWPAMPSPAQTMPPGFNPSPPPLGAPFNGGGQQGGYPYPGAMPYPGASGYPYPGATPYPGASGYPYPGATPYPGASGYPYPGATPYPNYSESPYPVATSMPGTASSTAVGWGPEPSFSPQPTPSPFLPYPASLGTLSPTEPPAPSNTSGIFTPPPSFADATPAPALIATPAPVSSANP